MKHNIMWTLRQSATLPDTLELYIYSNVEGDWYDWDGNKHTSETSAAHFREELEKHPNAKEITVYINSLGGSVMEGVSIYNQLKRHSAHKTVYVDGFACSIASVIAMAGDEVIMPRNTVMMIHNAWTVAIGNAARLRKAADDLDVLNEASRQAYLLKAGDKITEEQLTEMLDKETYLTAAQCIELGLADRFADEDADMQAAQKQLAQQNAVQKATDEMQQRREKAIAVINRYFG